MEIGDINQFLRKRIRIITTSKFTYVGIIEKINQDYIHFRDKYKQLKLISLRSIDFIEEIKP